MNLKANANSSADASSIDETIEKIDVIGYYHNDKWGELALKIDNNNEVKGVYDYRKGTLTGIYDPKKSSVEGWWCEEVNGKRTSFGHVEFKFEKDSDGKINLLGRWTNGYSKSTWYDDWNLTLNSKTIPVKMAPRLEDSASFCYKK